jgi:hypothetical protein
MRREEDCGSFRGIPLFEREEITAVSADSLPSIVELALIPERFKLQAYEVAHLSFMPWRRVV